MSLSYRSINYVVPPFQKHNGMDVSPYSRNSTSTSASNSRKVYSDNGQENFSTSDGGQESSDGMNEFRSKRSRCDSQRRSRRELTGQEYELIARDIMGKPPFSGSLKYHLPLAYASRCEEVRWEWVDPLTGRMCHKELIGGGKNSDLDF